MSVSGNLPASLSASLTSMPFGASPAGTAVELYTLRNCHGMEARIATYGGTVTALTAPDRRGHYADVVLGFDSLAGYLESSTYLGALIGRYANRIARAQFTLDGVLYTLSKNNGPNNLHGGPLGFDRVVWKVAEAHMTADGPQLRLTYLSPDGDQGFPGNLSVTAVYTLTANDALRLDYSATTDRDTVVNLTQHSYFNLRGGGDVLRHVVWINSSRFTPVDKTLIPTGALQDVGGTPFDFRQPTALGARIDSPDEQLLRARGYDHNWVIDRKTTGALELIASVYEPVTGRVLEVLSTEPGMQLYSGNSLNGTLTGKGGQVYLRHGGLALEPQHFPDSPNQPGFPPVVLKPGQTFRSTLEYRFSTRC